MMQMKTASPSPHQDLLELRCVIGQMSVAVFCAEMPSDSNIDIILQLVCFHYLMFVSEGGINNFGEAHR